MYTNNYNTYIKRLDWRLNPSPYRQLFECRMHTQCFTGKAHVLYNISFDPHHATMLQNAATRLISAHAGRHPGSTK